MPLKTALKKQARRARRDAAQLSIVIPCYNEAPNIAYLHERISAACSNLDYELIFVDDGSTDGTVNAVKSLRKGDRRVHLVSFVKNFGAQAASRAGLRLARGELIVTMDADLQHPPEIIPAMVRKASEGFDIVLMARDRTQSGLLKGPFSRLFYYLLSLVSGVKLDHRISEFRLVSSKVQRVLNMMPERNLFIRGLLPNMGFPYAVLTYSLGKRHAGKPAYTFGKLISLAVDATFAFSILPIRTLFVAGLLIAGGSFVYGIIEIYNKLFTDINPPGFTDVVASVLFLGGLNLVMLSVIGKYTEVIMDQVKRRPEYIIDPLKSDLHDSSDGR
jgi:polyisoprenyl-phosphate glycosyltransferase